MRRGVVRAVDVVGWRNGRARERRAVRVGRDIVGMAVGFAVEVRTWCLAIRDVRKEYGEVR